MSVTVRTTKMSLVWMGLLSVLVGCNGEVEPAEPEGPVDRYTVRGEVRVLPAADDPRTEFKLMHEAIPEYRNAAGEIIGMRAMTMAFSVAEDVSLEGVQVGDKVEVQLVVRYQPRTSVEIVELTKLPDGTELDLPGSSNQAPPTDAEAGDGDDHDHHDHAHGDHDHGSHDHGSHEHHDH